MTRPARARLFGPVPVAIAIGVAACGDAGGDPASDYPPARSALHPLDGQLLFPVHLDERPDTFWFVVDTGAFATSVRQDLPRDVVNGVGEVTLDLGEGIVLTDLSVFAADLSKAVEYIGVPIHGLLGQDVFQTHWFGLDYRRCEVTAATTVPEDAPPGMEAADAVEVPYTLEQLMPIVEVTIGEQTARLIADTGSGVTLLTESFVSSALLQGGLQGYVWQTSYGSDDAVVVRLPDLAFGASHVANEWAVVVPDDYHLRPVFDAMGLQVDGFLGYPVYRHFYLGVDGPGSRYRAWPYTVEDHLDPEEWDRVGVEVHRESGAVTIDTIYQPSDAATAGLLVGDVIEAIDGAPLDEDTLDEVRLRLRGAPGETRSLDVRRDATALAFTVAVDRLLAPR